MPREYRFRARVTYRGSKHASVSAAKGINYWHWVGLPTSSYYSVGSESQWVGFALAGRSSGGWLVPVRGIAPNTVSRCPGVAARSTPLSDWPIARRTARRGVSPSQRSTPPESRSRSGSRRLLSRERPSRSHCRWRRPTASRSSVRTPAHCYEWQRHGDADGAAGSLGPGISLPRRVKIRQRIRRKQDNRRHPTLTIDVGPTLSDVS